MRKRREIPKRFEKLLNNLQSKNIPFKISFFIVGIIATAWFLIRVIPKPSRAHYPCMRTAAPFMSSFIIYLLTLSSSSLLLKRARSLFFNARYSLAVVLFLVALFTFGISSLIISSDSKASIGSEAEDFIPNLPYGEGVGIFPGRVVWAWDPDATDENCTNTSNDSERGEDGYFMAKNNNQEVINTMFADAVKELSGTNSVADAWEQLFINFNERKERGSRAYQEGETIFIKINQGGGSWLTNDSDLSFKELNWTEKYYGMAETSPAAVITLLDQLVNDCGVPEENIMVGDPIAHIYKHNYDQMVAAFPNVKYVDNSHSDLGRTLLTYSQEPSIYWSDKGEVMPDAIMDYLYEEMENADYLINIAALKAHARAGITLTAKNHFGSHTRDGASHLHNGLIAPENDQPINTSYGQYRVLTDIMGHDKLGGNTLLFVVDGLWGGTEAVETPVKWNSAPFNGDWPNSFFISQDQVALESVCFDFLRNEFTDPNGPAKARPWMGAVDDYLHQAADSMFWAEGITYDPDGDGTPIGSLGVHEHWNNNSERLYSRNLGYDYGIELVATNKSLIERTVIAKKTLSTPTIDGAGTDECWEAADWYPIDQTWITWGEVIDSSDFYGRFKISWSEEENLLYYFVEITDDFFADGYTYPDDGYPNFDIVEVFIDENKSGGLHVFDDNQEWGLNSENAFSYHIAIDSPEEGEVNNSFAACDIDGTNWGDKTIENYADHFPELAMKKVGNKYYYEFSLIVYDDTYDNSNPESSRVTLMEDKLMGMSIAYCENDQDDGERDNFIGSVWVPEAEYNDHWMNADGYGSLRLVKEGTKLNHEVVVSNIIEDIQLDKLDTTVTVHSNISSLFSDPDLDTLVYSLEYDNTNLVAEIINDTLTIKATSEFSNQETITLKATDGEYEATVEFDVSIIITGINEASISVSPVVCYPNPVSDFVNIKLNKQANWSENIDISIYDISGKLLIQKDFFIETASNREIKINMTSLQPGNYILITKDKVNNQKFYSKLSKK